MFIRNPLKLMGAIVIGVIVGFALQPLIPSLTALADPGSASPAETLQVGFTVRLEKIADGFTMPTNVTNAGDGLNRLFVVEKPGRIMIIREGKTLSTPFLDITPLVGSQGYEQGLLSVAFHPDYKNNRYFYVDYTDINGDTVIARYQTLQSNPDAADPDSAKVLLMIDQPYPNHNGGQLQFGPDGYLYIGMGDGGSGGDPMNAGQDKFNLLGKILRLDVNNGDPYGIPADNPYADGKNGKPEVWAYGLRNPWRFSFDRSTHDLYIGDVGQNAYEEVDFVKAGTPGGLNFGWRVMEGQHCYPNSTNCDKTGLILPVAEYGHAQGISVTGGYVYRGQTYPAIQGYYFYADFGSTRMWALKETAPGTWEKSEVLRTKISVSSFGEDEAGELYLTDLGGGGVYHLTASPR